MSSKIIPMYDRVVVERLPEERKTAGGIVIPDNATEKPIQGKVVHVGKGKRLENGDFAALLVKVGDTVLFGKYSGTEVKLNGAEYLVMREDDILAIIEN
ncbi:MAG: co-chaperone GroES [Legionellales bacterium RIFCSPHIGHO2_12_FULL_37_14]|nr:MAG: co-chaperone GroES [Legionellales bacterium RIFCSPHIGHO2_12_FULL_37_14]